MFRSPPKSGKTSLLQLLKTAIVDTRVSPTVYYLPCHDIDIEGGETFRLALERKFGRPWKDFLLSGRVSSHHIRPAAPQNEFIPNEHFTALLSVHNVQGSNSCNS